MRYLDAQVILCLYLMHCLATAAIVMAPSTTTVFGPTWPVDHHLHLAPFFAPLSLHRLLRLRRCVDRNRCRAGRGLSLGAHAALKAAFQGSLRYVRHDHTVGLSDTIEVEPWHGSDERAESECERGSHGVPLVARL